MIITYVVGSYCIATAKKLDNKHIQYLISTLASAVQSWYTQMYLCTKGRLLDGSTTPTYMKHYIEHKTFIVNQCTYLYDVGGSGL